MLDITENAELLDENGNEIEVIPSDYYADKCVRQIKEAQQERDRLLENIDSVIEEYSAKRDLVTEKYNKRIEKYTAMLFPYFQIVEDSIKATKTQKKYRLASGSLKYTFEKKVMKDTPELLDELKNLCLNEYIKIEESVKWGDFKKTISISGDKVVNKDGEIIEGVSIETKPAKFEVIIE